MTDEEKQAAREAREARRNAAEVGSVAGEPASPPEPTEAPQSAQTLADYLHCAEAARIADGVVLVRVTHPDAKPGIHNGRFSGVHLAAGPVSALYSDGTTI